MRIETHERYSENREPFHPWVLRHVGARPGDRLLDVGSGPGDYHAHLSGVRVVALDMSAGMLAKVRIPKVRADAQALPFRAASFDRVMANHVLYHVPDQRQALREMRRVLTAGGRAVITTNSSDSLGRLFELLNEAGRKEGLLPERTVGARFSFDDAPMVREIFPAAQIELYRDAFVFPAVEPVVAYVASGAPSRLPEDVRARVLADFARRVSAVIEREGIFRVEKTAGCFVADLT